jgi:hypothetical protein
MNGKYTLIGCPGAKTGVEVIKLAPDIARIARK